MDPTNLLPGLDAMLQQRFGHLGYHLGTVLALAAWLLIVGAAAIVTHKAFVEPFWGLVTGDFRRPVIQGVLSLVVGAVLIGLAGWIKARRMKKKQSASSS